MELVAPLTKLCGRCGEHKPLSEFYRDKHRSDGYKSYCTPCVKSYELVGTRRDLSSVTKPCRDCGRTLPSLAFLFSANTDDGLTANCRTCRSHIKGKITAAQAWDHEETMEKLFRQAIVELISRYRYEQQDELLNRHRGEFEQILTQMMGTQGLLSKWKPPIWVNGVSSPNFQVS